jgi:molecular chaperone HscA
MAKIGINLTTGSLQQDNIIVGIDLGTTNSLIAIIHPQTGVATVLKETDHTTLVPSIVHFGENGAVKVGDEAKGFLISDPERTIFSVKRLMGKSYSDVEDANFFGYQVIDDGSDNLVKIKVEERFYNPVELSSYILKSLKQRAEHILKTPVNQAVITVPAYFNDTQRQATRDAGKLAGLDVLRIVNEPTAASLAYGIGLRANEEKTIAVYDLGGGTFDISVLHISGGVFEVLSTNGDTYLGGDDFDKAIVRHWLKEQGWEGRSNEKTFVQALRLEAEKAKVTLSSQAIFESDFEGVRLELTRETFERLIQPLVVNTIIACEQALKDAQLSVADIDAVVMVGGSTRVPYVKEAVSQFFGKPVSDQLNPDEVVALGAAIQADILAGNNKELLLLDITPLSLGIETMGGLMDVLIPRNAKIPTKAGRQYTTQKDGQGSMRIAVYQGERDLVKDNRKLAEFNLTGIPGMPAGLPKVEVSFLVNADGILVVKAKELRSGVEQTIEVKPQYGLTDAAVETMLLDSLQHAKEDIQTRALVEAQTEARLLLQTTQDFLVKNAMIVTPDELNQTKRAIENLEAALASETKDVVQQRITELNDISRPYAERLMDEAISIAMRGKKI